MPNEFCGECLFWKIFAEAKSRPDAPSGLGSCCRYPPVLDHHYVAMVDNESTDSSSCWANPVTEGDEWCGEFKRKMR